jgi:hypothetical protein
VIFKGPYDYEIMRAMNGNPAHYRIRDAADNRVATCYTQENADFVVSCLNSASNQSTAWTCGHIATGQCSECYTLLAQKATQLQEQVDGLQDEVDNLTYSSDA